MCYKTHRENFGKRLDEVISDAFSASLICVYNLKLRTCTKALLNLSQHLLLALLLLQRLSANQDAIQYWEQNLFLDDLEILMSGAGISLQVIP